VEPGIYFSPHLLAPIRESPIINQAVLERYKYVGGIRIEDAVAITQDGCDVLTKVGKSVDWIESVCSGSG
jgi:Xaa-Pro dipeptidase